MLKRGRHRGIFLPFRQLFVQVNGADVGIRVAQAGLPATCKPQLPSRARPVRTGESLVLNPFHF